MHAAHETITPTDIANFSYDYVANTNNIDKKTFEHRTNTPYNDYGYDNIDRFTGVTYHDSTSEDFSGSKMDDLGNRVGSVTQRDASHTYAVDTTSKMNRYSSIDSVSLSYDDAGNLTKDKNGYSYTYDYESRITRIYEDVNTDGDYDDGTDTNVAEYSYDALGRRIQQYDPIADSGTTTNYYYDDNRVILESQKSGQEQNFTDKCTYTFGNYIDEVLIMNDGTNDYYYGHDHLFSPAVLFASNGNVAERYEYNAYGKAHIYNSDFSQSYSALQVSNPYYFTGRHLDTLDSGNLEIMYYRARYYDCDTGRFLSHDPLDYVDGLNLYEYVNNKPLIYLDPSGTISLSEITIKEIPIEDVAGGPRSTWEELLAWISRRAPASHKEVNVRPDSLCTDGQSLKLIYKVQRKAYFSVVVRQKRILINKYDDYSILIDMLIQRYTYNVYDCVCPCRNGMEWRLVEETHDDFDDAKLSVPWVISSTGPPIFDEWTHSNSTILHKIWWVEDYWRWGCTAPRGLERLILF